MSTFNPPITHESSDDHFFGRYRMPVGVSVLWDGTTFVDRPYVWLGELDGLIEGETWFQGGRTYEVEGDVATRLQDAGYTVTFTGYGGGEGYGEGEYGS